MSIRMIARELYQLQQNVETIEQEIATAPYDRRADLERKLERARVEMRHMRKILDGRIDRSS